MDAPLVQLLSCQRHSREAKCRRDKRCRHLSVKPTLRRRFLVRKHERPLEDYKVIGHRWKCGNVWSLMILIGRKLDLTIHKTI